MEFEGREVGHAAIALTQCDFDFVIVSEPGITMSLDMATNEALLEQVLRRSDPQARYLFGNNAADNVIGLRPDFGVMSTPDDSMDDDGTVKDFDWAEPHAADRSPDEREERLKRGEDPID